MGTYRALASSLANVISPYPQRPAPNLTALPIAPLKASWSIRFAAVSRSVQTEAGSETSHLQTSSVVERACPWHRANLEHAFFARIGACSTACTLAGMQLLGPAGTRVGRPRWRGDNGSGGGDDAKGGGGSTWPRGLIPPYSSCLPSDWSDSDGAETEKAWLWGVEEA